MILWGPHNIAGKAASDIKQGFLSAMHGRSEPAMTADFLAGAAMWPLREMTSEMSIWNAPQIALMDGMTLAQ